MIEEEKVRFLFEKVQHSELQLKIESLKASILTGTSISYTTETNHLSTVVSYFIE